MSPRVRSRSELRALFVQPKELGPNGRRLCRKCHKEIPRHKKSWCSKECEHAFLLMTNSTYARSQVFKRDRGICAICLRDCAALDQMLRRAHREGWEARQALVVQMRALGFIMDRHCTRSTWEADHILPVVEGGGECGIENYRTLCTPCHKKVTVELRARIAKNRREASATGQIEVAP